MIEQSPLYRPGGRPPVPPEGLPDGKRVYLAGTPRAAAARRCRHRVPGSAVRARPVGLRQPLAWHGRDPASRRGRPWSRWRRAAGPGALRPRRVARRGPGRAARRPGRLAVAEPAAGRRHRPGAAAHPQGAHPRRGELRARRRHAGPAVRRGPAADRGWRRGAVHLAPDGRGHRDRRPDHRAALGRVGRHAGPRRGDARQARLADDRRRAPRPGRGAGGRGGGGGRVRRRGRPGGRGRAQPPAQARRRADPARRRDRRPGRPGRPGPGRVPQGAPRCYRERGYRPGRHGGADRLRGQGPARGVDLPAAVGPGELHRRDPGA